MAELSLCIAANHVHVLNLGHPNCFLLRACKILNRHAEHRNLESDTWQKTLEILLPVDVRCLHHWIDE